MIYDYLYIRDRGQTGEGHLYFMDLGEQNGNFEGLGGGGGGGGANKCNRAYWGTLKHKKTNFHFLGGNKLIFISGEQWNRPYSLIPLCPKLISNKQVFPKKRSSNY